MRALSGTSLGRLVAALDDLAAAFTCPMDAIAVLAEGERAAA